MKALLKISSVVALAMTLSAGIAKADIPPPPGGNNAQPGQPGTTAPNGQTCNTGAGAAGNPNSPVPQPAGCPTPDTTHGNTPPATWFNEMHNQLFLLEQQAHLLAPFGMGVYVNQLVYVIDTYYSYTFDQFGNPLYIPSIGGFATRGDFNFVFYFWIRPLVFDVFYSGVNYVQNGSYIDAVNGFDDAYHGLTQCMYGKKAGDPTAFDDNEAFSLEQQAGVHRN